MVRVGVIGGGQLAWMMAAGAKKLGVELIIQTPSPTDPAVAIATHTFFAPVADAHATAELAQQCDVITFENEFVDLDALFQLEQQGVRFYPTLESIAPLLDKYHQRAYLQDRNLPTPAFQVLQGKVTDASFSEYGFPVVLKSRRLGYDGQGTFILNDFESLLTVLGVQAGQSVPDPDRWLLEEFVPFERELAVIAVRSIEGNVVTYPVVETQQVQQVCRRVLVLPEWPSAIVEQVQSIAYKLLDSLGYVGVMGIEFFLTPEGRVLVNETAPRTHNSGHYSLDACVTSQFEQQLRAVCHRPLGDPSLTSAGALMVNLLGFETADHDYAEKRKQLAQLPHTQVYWYGKSAARPGRKLGHVTVLLQPGEGRSQALDRAETIESIWYG